MSGVRPRMYLDIDGVINAQMPMDWGKTSEGVATSERMKFKIRWAPAMVEELRKISEEVDIVWCTTWRDDAPDSMATLLGFGSDFRVLHPLGGGATTFPSIYWKYAAIVAEQEASPSPFIWIDDEQDEPHREWARLAGGLAITPNEVMGIRAAHVEWVVEYVADMKRGMV